jgi:hypothetical protein
LGDAIGVRQEPAPYAIPPLDFARRRVLLLPKHRPESFAADALPRWFVLTADDARGFADAWWREEYEPRASFGTGPWERARITWANKSVWVFERTQSLDTP